MKCTNSILSVQWVLNQGTNCYPGKGAERVTQMPNRDFGVQLHLCKTSCIYDSECTAVVYRHSDRVCYRIKNIEINLCAHGERGHDLYRIDGKIEL